MSQVPNTGHTMQQQNSGFSLIELITVIMILGMVSALALPGFVDLGSDAKVANIHGIGAAFQGRTAGSCEMAGGRYRQGNR